MITLRPDQADLKQRVYNDWFIGKQNVLAVLPTGGGKSIICTDVVKDGIEKNLLQTVIAHRNELVGQMSVHLANRGISHGVIASNPTITAIRSEHREKFGKSFINPSAITNVVSVDTLIARKARHEGWARGVNRWIIDEAHHVLKSNKWGKAVAMFPNAQGLGVTATPLRADRQGLGIDNDGVFYSLQEGLNMRQLIQINALSDYEIVCPRSDLDVEEMNVAPSGDWSPKVLKDAAKKSKIVGDVVDAYERYCHARKAIVFATDIETANNIAQDFQTRGIKAASLSSKTPNAVRAKYIAEFKNNTLDVLINVDLFDEGFDVPACDVVIMARPTASLGKYRQMVGRGLRYVPGKTALIVDMVSNVVRHGLPCKNTVWTLDRGTKKAKQEKDPDEIELTTCMNPECAQPYEKFRTECPYCGFVPPIPETQKRTIEQVDGDLILLDKETLKALRRECELETPAAMGSRVAHAGGDFAGKRAVSKQMDKIAAQDELKKTIAIWAGQKRANGLSDREIHKQFFLTSGSTVLDMLSGQNTRKDYDNFNNKIKEWVK